VDIAPPWLARVAVIKEAASHNLDTERKVARQSEELKDLLREVKIRVSPHPFCHHRKITDGQDQTLQESGVKVEILERRLEATRKQADQILELENDITKAKKQEKVYSDAIEQLQAEQDALEAENAKLRKGQGVDVRDGGAVPGLGELLVPAAGLESSQLAEQVSLVSRSVRSRCYSNGN
jgi:dynactin 1